MKKKAPSILKLSFICGECEKEQSVKVAVVDFLGKNHFSFQCKKCQASWIIYFYETGVEHPTKTKIENLIRNFRTKEPQPIKIGDFTFELQPLNIKESVDPDRLGIIRIGDVTCGLQPMKEINLLNSSRFSAVKNIGKSPVAGMKNRLGGKNISKGAIEK